ncbi:MAG: VCBS repeat-containing protein, partial [Gammaproteobacteria bacterium]|nr:VCBS repeat-containing protein [Gammaproteobacteria bacterium]
MAVTIVPAGLAFQESARHGFREEPATGSGKTRERRDDKAERNGNTLVGSSWDTIVAMLFPMSTRPALALLLVLSAGAGAAAAGAATGDIDGDGRDELLLRHAGSAAWIHYDIEDGVGRRRELALDLPEADRLLAIADLDGDGRDDVLARANGTNAWSWHRMGEGVAERRDLTTLTRNPLFTFQAAGDFDGDGDDDVLLRNSSTGQFIYYESRLGAGTPRAILRRGLGLTANLLFEVIAAGDLNGDGRDDVLMRHARLGHWIHYEMSRERGVLRRPSPRFTQNLLFEFAGIGDLDGDGDEDLMLRHIGDGEWIYYAMSGATGELERDFGMPRDLGHDLVAVADFDGDGRGTPLLRHPDSGDWIAYRVSAAGSERLPVSGITWDLAWTPTSAPRAWDPAMFCAVASDDRTPSYVGHVAGHAGNPDELEVILTGPGTLRVVQPDGAGCFAFNAVPRGEHAVKVIAYGHETSPARPVRFPFRAVWDAEAHAVRGLATDPFVYHWEEDRTTPAGAEYSSRVVRPRVVEFQGATVDVVDSAAAERLRQEYNVLLVGEGWSQEHAHRLFQTMQSIPQKVQDPFHDRYLPASAWRLTDEFIDGDISIDAADDGTREVAISSAAFVNAAPRIATVDGKRGVWFSRRLHHSAVRFVTDEGRDRRAYERIFKERYGVTTVIGNYTSLTAPTGHESHHNFQRFHANEILLLINMLEEMPTGMHKLDGMRYLVRRL